MSVYKKKGETQYFYDFRLRGRRFAGGTGATEKREAKRIEQDIRERAKAALDAEERAAGGPLTLERAASRYWIEVGQHHANAATTLRDLIRLQEFFGKPTPLAEITDKQVAELVAWRRAQTVKGRRSVADPKRGGKKRPAPLVSAATVNRSTIEPLQKLFNRARKIWRIPLPDEPRWKDHLLAEPRERVREVRAGEEAILEEAIRADYLPLIDFARAAGLRLSECLLRKDEVDLVAGRIRTMGKGRKPIDHPITSEMRAILMEAMANPTEHVFTYAAVRAKKGEGGHARGDRLPITVSGLKSLWRRAKHRKKGARLPADLKFHDLRHDFATKLLRETGNIKLVQRALNHSKIETTMRYAHILDEEVAEGMEAASRQRNRNRPKNAP